MQELHRNHGQRRKKTVPEVCMDTGQKVNFLRGNNIHTENPKVE